NAQANSPANLAACRDGTEGAEMGPSAEDRGLYENSSAQKNKNRKTESQRERGGSHFHARAYLDLPGVYPRTLFPSGRLGAGANRGPEAGVAGGGGDQGCSARRIVAGPQSYSRASSAIVAPAALRAALLRLWPASRS